MRRCIAGVVGLVGLAGLIAGWGCSSPIRHPPYAPQPASALFEVTLPPPPGRVESVPAAPTRDAVWVDGEWRWRRHKWGWQPGYWTVIPKDAKFSAWVFVRGTDGRFWSAPGAWRDSTGAQVPAPPELSAAKVDAAEIVNAVGETENVASTAVAMADAGGK
jgi:hypothetical protein